MISTLRSLERRLVIERSWIGVGSAVDDFIRRWEHALGQQSETPDPLVLIKTLVEAGFHLPTTHYALLYLSDCHRAASLPDRDRLLGLLLMDPSERGVNRR